MAKFAIFVFFVAYNLKKYFWQISHLRSNFSGRSYKFNKYIYILFSISLFDNSPLTLNTKLVNVVADETHFVCPPSPTNNPRILTNRSRCIKKRFFIQTFSENCLREGGGFWFANKHWFLVWCCNLRREGQAWIIFGHSMKFNFWLSLVT